ncbi:MAG: hypothetical protein ACKVQW_07405 [Pyrinomonadaceae bacterium]
MLISLVLILLITLGGMSCVYLIDDRDEPGLMWRLAVGNVVGSAVFGLAAFVAACLIGFSPVTIVVSLVIATLPLLVFTRRDAREQFRGNLSKARGKLDGANFAKIGNFVYYAFFFFLFWLFFARTVFELKDGIYTGGSQNLGDLPFHLGAIFSFTDGNNFPPQNPSWAGAKFTYPFIADFLTACFVKLGADVKDALFTQNMAWAFSLLVILERFVARLTESKLAGRIAPALLFFSGGLGFVWFAKDLWESGQGVWYSLTHLTRDYTIGEHFRWGNSMVVLFMTQRSLLLGMPLTVLVLGYLWRVFATETTEGTEKTEQTISPLHLFASSPLLTGLLAGTLPLIHLHSLAVLFVVTAFCFVLRPDKWREWIGFGIGVSIIAVPQLIWALTGSATETTKFFEWHFGWDKRDENFVWFWFKNTGLVIPAIAAAIFLISRKDPQDAKSKNQKPRTNNLLLFYVPFVFLFIVSNVAKLAPWEWDNIKILIYWFVGSLPLIALLIAWLWEQKSAFKVVAAACFVGLVSAGALDVWRTASGQISSRVFDYEAVRIANEIKQKTAPNALFVNAPTYNSAIVLSGRRSLMRYSGHLSSHGIDYGPREEDVRRIYQGGGVAEILLRKHDVDYVLISPAERESLSPNDAFFAKYAVVAEAGQYRVYKIKN